MPHRLSVMVRQLYLENLYKKLTDYASEETHKKLHDDCYTKKILESMNETFTWIYYPISLCIRSG